MGRLPTFGIVLSLLLIAVPVSANSGILYVDDDGLCDGNTPCLPHPQDAVNAASPGDSIRVYPGTYGPRVYTSKPPHWGVADQHAPALIVYKDGLTIQAVDPDPANTIIETTHDYWCNPVAIQASTGGIWDGSQYVGAGVYPAFGTAPNAVAIIASNVTIRGFTLRKPHMGVGWGGFWNTAGVTIGGLYTGDPDHLGSDGNKVQECVFEDVWQAVVVWHSSGNTIAKNVVKPLDRTDHWAAISIYDGYNADQINLGYPSRYNEILNNAVANRGIFVGAFAPPIWTDNTGTQVHANRATALFTAYSSGSKNFSGNKVQRYDWYEASDYKFPGKSNEGIPPGWTNWDPAP